MWATQTLRHQGPYVDVRHFGADPTGVAPSQTQILAALAVAKARGTKAWLPPNSTFRITSTLNLGDISSTGLVGSGPTSVLSFDNVAGTGLVVDLGPDLVVRNADISNFLMTGKADTVIRLYGMVASKIEWLTIKDASMSIGYDLMYSYGSSFANLTITGQANACTSACFRIGDSFNANTCSNWYTAAWGTPANFLFNGTGKGNTFNNLTGQGGVIGLDVQRLAGSSFHNVYTESVVLPIKLGDTAASLTASGLLFIGGSIQGSSGNTSRGLKRAAVLSERSADCTFINVDFDAVSGGPTINIAATGTAPAFAVPICGDLGVSAGGLGCEIRAVEVICGGAGYTDPPAVTVTSSGGSGFAATAVVTNGKVTAINVNAAGTGYQFSGVPVMLEYVNAWNLRMTGCSVAASVPAHANLVRTVPVWPFIVRNSGASTTSYLIIDDKVLLDAQRPKSAVLTKKSGSVHDHVLEYRDATETPVRTTYPIRLYS